MRSSEIGAMDVESRDFKSYAQVPRWWTFATSGFAIVALLMAIIAIAISGAALNKANDDDGEVTETALTTNQQTANSEPSSTAPTDTTEESPTSPSPTPASPEPTSTTEEENNEERTGHGGPGSMRTDPLPGSGNYTGYHHQPRPRRGLYFDVVVHGAYSSPYWNLVEKGIDDAAQRYRVDVDYHDPEQFGQIGAHEEVIEDILGTSINLKSGLAVSFLEHDPDFQRAVLEVAEDVPVLSMLLDYDLLEQNYTGSFARVGFSNAGAGRRAAEHFSLAGVNSTLCIIHEGDEKIFGDEIACDALYANINGEREEPFTVNLAAPELTRQRIARAIEANGVRGILTLELDTFNMIHEYLDSVDLLCSNEDNVRNSNCVMLGTFDENEAVLQGIIDGEVAFAMDSQQYLQGYLAIMMLTLKSTLQVDVGNNIPVITGPRVIDNVDLAQKLLSRNIMANQTLDNRTAEELTVRFIVHGKSSDPFWRAVRRGARFARRAYGMKIEFYHPRRDMTSMEDIANYMAGLIEDAVQDQRVDALILTIPTQNENLIEAIEDVTSTGNKPVFTINTGHQYFANLSIQSHVGAAEMATSFFVAERLLDMNVNKVLCVIPEAGNEDLEQRCRGLGADINNRTIEVEILDSAGRRREFHVDMENRDITIRDEVSDALADTTIDCVVSAAPAATVGVRDALADLDLFCIGNERPDGENDTCVEFVAYDLMPQVFTYIKNDEMTFAVDSQPVVQGFLPVTFAMLELLWGSHPLGLVQTAPKFVNITNVENAELYYTFEYS